MTHHNLPYWLALLHAPQLSVRRARQLLAKHPSPRQILQLDSATLQQLGLKDQTITALKTPNWSTIEIECRWAEQTGHAILTQDDQRYPMLLKQIHDPPLVLYIKGNSSLFMPQLAMVGSRNPTPAGRETAYEFAYILAQAELAITSGMALGIDAESHLGCLHAGGHTIAVLGSGLQRIYPQKHQKLAEQIAAKGALISPFPLDAKPHAGHFPQRNRIISGLSLGTLVVEATPKSGSLITARFALEQGREIFAIPGSIHNPQSRGCHQIIQQGAKLVEQASDILEELVHFTPSLQMPLTEFLQPQQKSLRDEGLAESALKLLECVGFEATPFDVIARRSRLDAVCIMRQLTQLELQGKIIATPTGYCRCK